MSDVTFYLQIPGAQLESIDRSEDEITLHFSKVELIQKMENAFEDSLWTQAINLTLKGISVDGDLPEAACEIQKGELTDNIYTYRDSVPMPVDWHGEVNCTFAITGTGREFSIDGTSMQLEQIAHPRYIKHFKKD